jgi:hypothetical protein
MKVARNREDDLRSAEEGDPKWGVNRFHLTALLGGLPVGDWLDRGLGAVRRLFRSDKSAAVDWPPSESHLFAAPESELAD